MSSQDTSASIRWARPEEASALNEGMGSDQGRLLVAVGDRGVVGAVRVRTDPPLGRVIVALRSSPLSAGQLTGLDRRLVEVGEALCLAVGCERVQSSLSFLHTTPLPAPLAGEGEP